MLLGIFFGTTAYIAISGFMLGFREYLVDQLIGGNAHVHIEAREDFLNDHSLDKEFYNDKYDHIFWGPAPSGRKDSAMVENPQDWYQRLRGDPRVIAYSPQLSAPVVFSKGRITATGTLIGCDPLQQTHVTNIGEHVKQGQFSDLAAGGNRIILGAELKKKLGVDLEQFILASFGNERPTPFKVVGFYESGNRIGDVNAYATIGDVQKVSGRFNQINEIGVKLSDYKQAAVIADSWAAMSHEKVESWDQQNASTLEVFTIQDAVRFLSIGAIMIVAGFGIYNVLNMTVVQKRKDIAILRSMGYSRLQILSLFFYQGLLLGIVGVLTGVIFGFILSLLIKSIPFGGGPLGMSESHLMVSFAPSIYIQASLLALAASLFASVLPARSASKLEPIEIIRSGAE
jgi:lipoprotein-releasing system permease protein